MAGERQSGRAIFAKVTPRGVGACGQKPLKKLETPGQPCRASLSRRSIVKQKKKSIARSDPPDGGK